MSETDKPPSCLTEMDRLKLSLMKEKGQRLQAETLNLQMMQRALQAQHAAFEEESKAFSATLKATYALEPGDEIGEDGAIKRTPVRSIKKEI